MLALILLIGTMLYQSLGPLREAGAWKSSALAMIHALDAPLQTQLGGISKESAEGDRDSTPLLKLVEKASHGREWRLVGKSDEVPLEEMQL